jgi:carboxyl-terminal processing protease
MAASLHEGHTVFLTPREYEDLKGWQRGDVSYAGIGARLAGSPPMIFEVFADSPAERAGLEYGDTITAANGRSASALRLDEIVGLLRGDAGTSVRMTVQHPDGEQNDLTLVRAKVKVDFVTSTTLDGRVGYIRLRGFPEPKVAAAVEQAIDDFRARDLRELVVDLRGNSGGRLDVGMETLGLFMANTDAYVEVTREGRRTVRTANRRAPAAGLRTAVLVDAATSSMGEIFAAAIKEHQSGQVVGTNTAGSVAAGRVFALADGSALQVTVSRLESAAGITINEHGVEPNVFVARGPDDVRNGRDPQLESALAFLADGSISLGAPKNSSPAQ